MCYCLVVCKSCETPVIAPKVGGIPEVIDHEVNGYVYDLGDNETLTRYMLELLDDPQKVRQMGTKGRQKVVDKFESSKIADSYVNWYEKILGDL